MRQLRLPEGMLRISWFLPQTDCLGPGRRFALWVQGCDRRCRGCIAPGLQAENGGTLCSLPELAAAVIGTQDIEGLTISGGEPFLQAAPLAELLCRIRAERPSLGVILYTGFLYADLQQDADAAPLLHETDLLIDGEYIQALDDGAGMRGSSNQHLHFLTARYTPDALPQSRKSEIRFDGNALRMIGIPSDAARQMLEILKEGEGTPCA